MIESKLEPARWWLGGLEDRNELPGSVEIDDAGNITVHVYRLLPGLEEIPFFAPPEALPSFAVIHGISMNDHWTLIDCRIVGMRNSIRLDVCDITLRPRLALAGDFLIADEDLAVTSARFALWDQDEWSEWAKSLQVTRRDIDSGQNLLVQQVPPQRIVSRIEGAEVSLEDDSWGVAVPDADRSLRLRARSAWQLELDNPCALDNLVGRWIEPFVFLITTATRRKTGLGYMTVGSTSWQLPDGVRERSLRLYAQSGLRPIGEIPSFGLLHTASDWDLPSQLPALFSFVRDHRFAVDQYLSYRNSSGSNWQMRFAVLYQVVESLDRSLEGGADIRPDEIVAEELAALDRALESESLLLPIGQKLRWAVKHAGEKSLAQRFSRLDRAAGRFLSSELGERSWIGDLANLRNSVAHGLEAAKKLVEDRGPLWTGAELLELLCELRMLIAVDFSPAAAATIVRDNARWYGRITALKRNLPALKELAETEARDRHRRQA